jgi:hypothetical protein
MSILTAPPFVMFVNNDLSDQVKSVFVRQFYLSEIMTGAQFDGYVASIDGYVQTLYIDGYRVMVERDLSDHTNRQLANITVFYKNGLLSVLKDGYGPPTLELPLDRVSFTNLINQLKYNPVPTTDGDLDDGFVGQRDSDDFDPHTPDGNPNIEPRNI